MRFDVIRQILGEINLSVMDKQSPGLFGLVRSNRDFGNADSWGKNQFNSSFPAALCCYLSSRGLSANYLQCEAGKFSIGNISISELFGTDPLGRDTYFGFETAYSPYDQYAIGLNPRTDLVISTTGESARQTAALEVKLTALPDSTTFDSPETDYGSELVVRPDTIFYLAAGLAHHNRELLNLYFTPRRVTANDWSDPDEALVKFADISLILRKFLMDDRLTQIPNILQPVWKTNGKAPSLSENCLDVFAWSTTGFLHFVLELSASMEARRITRPMRTVIWTYSMLVDIAINGQTNFQETIDQLSYNTKNDKAFASSGSVTRNFMKHANLTKPRIKKEEIKNIIFGGGQNLLSPERRFDAIIVNSPEIFL